MRFLLPLILMALPAVGSAAPKAVSKAAPKAVSKAAPKTVSKAAPKTAATPAPESDPALHLTIAPHEDPGEGLDTDARQRLVWLDFGLSGTQPNGAWVYDQNSPTDAYSWTGGMVRIVRRDARKYGPYVCDFMEGEDSSFLVSTNARESCRIVVTLGDPEKARGPIRIQVPGLGEVKNLVTKAGEYKDVGFEVPSVAGRLAFRVIGDKCSSFAVSGLVVFAMPGVKLKRDLYERASALEPATGSGDSTGRNEAMARDLLKQVAWFLVKTRPVEGCFSSRGTWYESAYPIRTLLAAGRVLDEAAFTDAAIDCLDRFQSEQLPDGNWSARYFGRRGCGLAKDEVTHPQSANLADVGTMVLALVVGSANADSARQALYLSAAKKYVEQVVLPNQLPDGSFPNLRHEGVDYKATYSVATGVQAAVLAATFGATKDPRYEAAADSAAKSLLADFQPDGKFQFHRHDYKDPTPITTVRFGDLYYVLEGLLWVRHYTTDKALADAIGSRLEEYLWGVGGLSAFRVSNVLWHPADDWEASKAGALLFLLNEFYDASRDSGDPVRKARAADTETWIREYVAWLRDPKQAATLGVALDPASPKGKYAFPATGFAGIGISSTIDIGRVFP